MSILDERVALTLGLRHQNIISKSYASGTGLFTSGYSQSANSPVIGLVVKPWENVSVYANHIEGLTAGDTAGGTFSGGLVANSGTTLPPYKSKQNEVGFKIDAGKIGGGVALFEIKKPSSGYDLNGDGTYTFGAAGLQTNRGIELTMYGDPFKGLHLNGGYSLIDAKLSKTQGGTNDGHYAAGTSRNLFNLAADWDVPYITNFVLSANYIYTDKQYVNSGNTASVPAWSRVDVGARYKFNAQNQTITLRAAIENLGNKSYWIQNSQSNNVLTLGNPRTYKLSASVDF